MNGSTGRGLQPVHLRLCARDVRYAGGGYLRWPRWAAGRRERADELLLDWANAHHWTYEDLFFWVNGHQGRVAREYLTGSRHTVEDAFKKVIADRILDVDSGKDLSKTSVKTAEYPDVEHPPTDTDTQPSDPE